MIAFQDMFSMPSDQLSKLMFETCHDVDFVHEINNFQISNTPTLQSTHGPRDRPTDMLLPDVQSAYRKDFFRRKAVSKVYSDIVDANSNENVVLLSLLDLTVVFDTVDHDIHLQRLMKTFGFGGLLLEWIRSYLCNRAQDMHLNGVTVTNVH